MLSYVLLHGMADHDSQSFLFLPTVSKLQLRVLEFKSCDKAAMLNEVADKVCVLAQPQLCSSSHVDVVVYHY